ncbi:MAG TPA: replicative DNA helicase [Parachlamydiales bacterium]|nr:replicative DNA helicase [Parachlamydiales bacterium]
MSETKTIKVAPHSKESEMMVLGCMLTSINSLNIAADGLNEEDFYFSEHKTVFQTLKNAYLSDKPADVHLIAEELKRQEKLKAIGGVAYLTTLAQYAGTSAYIEEYTQLVKSKALLRRMIFAAQEIEKNALSDPDDVSAVLDNAQAKLFAISQEANPSIGMDLKEILSGAKAESHIPYLKELQQRQEEYQKKGPNEIKITGIPTHFLDLDKLLNGFSPSNLIILAARPAMGKTALALNIAENICFKNHLPVGIFSLEMTAEQLLHRIICSQSGVESEKIKTGALNGTEYQRIVSCIGEMQKHLMIVDDTPGLKITDLRARARRMKESHNIGFLIVDYLQLLSGSGFLRLSDNRQNEISEISRLLKNLARELNIPLLCLAQLSRKVEERQGHRPMMSDLRESGCLTGDALITDAKTGQQIPIQTLAERKRQTPILVKALNPKTWKLEDRLMTKAFCSGKKMVYELATKSGRTIKASANHPFLKLEGWTRLDQLNIGDKLAISRRIDIQPPQNSYTNNEKGSVNPKLFLTNIGAAGKRGMPVASLLAESDVYWDEINSITALGEETVYDATVEGLHNFAANDLIVHNSIEQDSDQVLFLLRREYYDPYDKPGFAELIVAKNRHGGVGTIPLAFRKEIAQFVNHTKFSSQEEANDEAFSAFSPAD